MSARTAMQHPETWRGVFPRHVRLTAPSLAAKRLPHVHRSLPEIQRPFDHDTGDLYQPGAG
ncbi:hypothetical protein ACTSKR_07060 [Chitinibacteraceae bacterium HSL-7]